MFKLISIFHLDVNCQWEKRHSACESRDANVDNASCSWLLPGVSQSFGPVSGLCDELVATVDPMLG